MRICLVALDYKPYRSSGLTLYVEDLARGLVEAGHRVTVVASQRPGLPARHTIEGVEVYRAPIDGLDWITYSRRAARLLAAIEREQALDVVHFADVHFAYAYPRPYVASLWQSFRQRLTACHGGPYHNGALDQLKRQGYYRLARRYMEEPSLARAGRLIAACGSTRQEFVAHYRVAPERIDLVRQGIDTDLFRPTPAGGLRRRLGLDACRLLFFMGFITPRKGLEYLARALRLLPEDVHLLVAGRWDGPCHARFAKELDGIAHRVHEVGFVPDRERPSYYAAADLYVSPSLLEGLGITPIEALACGTPAIVTAASSGPEEVGDPRLVVPPQDPQALARAIRRLLEDEALRRELGRRGRERVLELFSYQRMAELTARAYDSFKRGGSRDGERAGCVDQPV